MMVLLEAIFVHIRKMAISILHGLAHHQDKLKEVFKYSTEYTKGMNNEEDDFHHRAAKFPIKSLLKLIEKISK